MYRAFDASDEAIAKRKAYHQDAVGLAKRHGVTALAAPGHTKLVRELFADPNAPQIGAGVYNLLSGIAHASPPSLIEFFKQSEPPGRAEEFAVEAAFVQPAIRLDQLELSIQLAAYGISRTIDALLPFAGWPADLWPKWRRHLLTTVFRGVEAPNA